MYVLFECRVESYVYDEDVDDMYASKDADFSLNPCTKLKKRSLKKGTDFFMFTCKLKFLFNFIYF